MDAINPKQQCRLAWEDYDRRYEIEKEVPDAVWKTPIIRPEKPKNYKQIINYGKRNADRKFPFHTDTFIRRMENLGRSKSQADQEEFGEFVAEEWRRRKEGLFFFNGNKLEWVTGRHYCYLQYWKIQATREVNGSHRKGRYRPDFRDNQRDIFYAFMAGHKDPKCAGIVFIDKRRSGKTSIILSDGYFDTTENPESVFPVQSKSELDAKKMFKKLVDSWKTIPYWFKPQDTGETTSVSQLFFGEKKKTNQTIKERQYEQVLNSVIYPINSKEEALDGEYASYIFRDEVGKTARNVNIEESWEISKWCVFDGNLVVGFAVYASTVEDQDKFGSKSLKNLWDKSDPAKIKENGFTQSGMHRLFLPAYYGFVGDDGKTSFVDEWGYSNKEAAKKYHQKEYDSKEGDAKLSYQRKFPITIGDAWVTNEGKNNFSTRRLIEHKIWNDMGAGNDVVRGNFMWRNGERWGMVDFYPDPSGRWLKAFDPVEHDRNKFEFYHGGQKKPTRNYFYTGIDPFSHKKVVDVDQGSNGAAITVFKSYPNSKIREGVACVYDYRQTDPNLQVEDFIMQCVYYSSPALIESNVSVAVNGFNDKGFGGYAMPNPLEENYKKMGKQGYATTSAQSVEDLIAYVTSWILDNLGKNEAEEVIGFCPYNELIEQLMDFDPVKRGPYDMVMALGLSLIAMRSQKKKAEIQWDFSDWIGKGVDQSVYNRLKATSNLDV